MNFNTRVKVIAACITTCFVLLICAILCFGMIGYNNTHEWQIYQSIGGRVSVVDTPGYYWKGFGTVWTYPRSTQYYYSASNEEGPQTDQSIRVTFNDGGTAQISSFVKIQLPPVADHRMRLHQDYGGNLENIRAAIRAHLTNCIKSTGPMMSASENQAARKAEFNQTVEEQLARGLFKMRRTTIELDEVAEIVEGVDATGKKIVKEKKAVVQATEIIEKDGAPIIVQASPLQLYGVSIIQFSVTNTNYDPKTREQFAAKKEAYLAAERAKAQRQEETQQRLMIIEKGLRQVAETEAAANLEKKKATVEADKLREVAEIDKARAVIAAIQKVEVAGQEKQEAETRRQIADIQALTAELKKRATISAAEAKQQEIEIAGGLAEKDRVLAEIKANRDVNVAASLANVKVPSIVIIGGSANGEGASEGMTDTLMNLLLLKSTGIIDPTAPIAPVNP